MNIFVEINGTYYNKLQVSHFKMINWTMLVLYLSNGDRFEIKTKTFRELENFINELRNLE